MRLWMVAMVRTVELRVSVNVVVTSSVMVTSNTGPSDDDSMLERSVRETEGRKGPDFVQGGWGGWCCDAVVGLLFGGGRNRD